MNNIVTLSPVTPATVDATRTALATAIGSTYGALIEYATSLNAAFPGWYLIERDNTTNEGKVVHAEKAALYTVLKSAKHTNPSTIWARARKYGYELDHPATTVEGVEGEGGEGSTAEKSKVRAIEVRMVEELLKLHKAVENTEHPTEAVRAADTLIQLALAKLGVTIEAK